MDFFTFFSILYLIYRLSKTSFSIELPGFLKIEFYKPKELDDKAYKNPILVSEQDPRLLDE